MKSNIHQINTISSTPPGACPLGEHNNHDVLYILDVILVHMLYVILMHILDVICMHIFDVLLLLLATAVIALLFSELNRDDNGAEAQVCLRYP